MAKRFPVLYPMPFGEEQYKEYLERANEPISRQDYVNRCWEEVLPSEPRVCSVHQKEGPGIPRADCTDCMRYDKSMTIKTIVNLISWGFLDEDRSPDNGKRVVTLPDHSLNYLKDSLSHRFSDVVLLSLEAAWDKPKSDQVALEAFIDILAKVPENSQEPKRQKDLFDELSMDSNPIRGYDFNIAKGGSARTLREILKLLNHMGAVDMDDRGRSRRSGDSSRVREVKRKLRDLCKLEIAEKTIDILGPNHPLLPDRFIMALSKYYIYRCCRGIGKQRKLASLLDEQIEIAFEALMEQYEREAKSLGRQVRRGKNLGTLSTRFRNVKVDLMARRLGFSSDAGEFKRLRSRLRSLSVSSLERLVSCENLEELRNGLKRAAGRFDRSILDEMKHNDGEFMLPKDFMFHSDWQEKAVEAWIQDAPNDGHKKYSGIVSAVTGSGKTPMAMLAIQHYLRQFSDARVSIIVPTKVLLYQWVEELAKLLGLSSKRIGLRGDGFKDSFSDGKRVVVSIVNSAILDDNLRQDVASLPDDIRHLLIADECHRYGGEEFKKVFDCRTDARLGLSATPPADESENSRQLKQGESDAEIDVIFEALGEGPFFHLNYQEAREKGLICKFMIKYVGVQLTQKERLKYQHLKKGIGKALEKIRLRYGHRIDAMKATSLDQKLQTILKHDEHPDPAIGKYFRLTKERRDVIHQCRNRKLCYTKILKNWLPAVTRSKKTRKIMVFHEKISQLEDIVAPVWRRLANVYKKDGKDIDSKEREADQELQKWLEVVRFRPVIYHSLQDPKWNRWSIEWFRSDVANVMLSVKALVEGVDVPEADLGVVRVSSSSVRQRIQTIGRILRKGKDKNAVIYVLFALDTVDTNIFRAYDWESELGQAAIEYEVWNDITGEFTPQLLHDLPIPQDYVDTRPPLEVDVSGLKPGDEYPGRFAGDMYHVTADGRPYKRSSYGRVFIENKDMVESAQIVRTLKGGGKVIMTPQGNFVTRIKGRGSIFLGTGDSDAIRDEVDRKRKAHPTMKKGKKRIQKVPTFEELFGSAE